MRSTPVTPAVLPMAPPAWLRWWCRSPPPPQPPAPGSEEEEEAGPTALLPLAGTRARKCCMSSDMGRKLIMSGPNKPLVAVTQVYLGGPPV